MKLPGSGALHRFSGASTVAALRRRSARPDGAAIEPDPGSDPFRWQTVTILAQPHQLCPDGRLPAPLTSLGELIEIRMEPAPGGRGTQLSARTRRDPAVGSRPAKDSSGWKGVDPAVQLRSALQQVKQLIEAGEVLAVQAQPAQRRRPARGLLVDLMTGDADQDGLV